MIPIVKPFLPPREVLMPCLESVLYSGYIAQGERVDVFEAILAKFFGSNRLVTLNSGTAALHLALRLIGVGEGDEVISTPLTAEPTNTAILQTGAKVIWADVEPNTGLICPTSVGRLITPKTKAIMVVHYAGMVADMNGLLKIKKRFGIPIIEDCAHAFGAEFKAKKLGFYSDYSVYSFQAIKHLTTVDGGLLLVNTEEDLLRARKLRWFGLDKSIPRLENNITEAGYKYHMNNVNAEIGIVQMKFLKENVEKYIENGKYFDQNLESIDGLSTISYHKDSSPSYWLYTCLVENRDSFIRLLKSKGIDCSTLHLRNDRHEVFGEKADLPGLDEFCSKFIHWGCGHWINPDDRGRIVEVIRGGW